ncbi:hypothetical protein BKA70DRAFT_1338166, partial [Coprinopsis sp. MPI-PUGE-AT-0042]
TISRIWVERDEVRVETKEAWIMIKEGWMLRVEECMVKGKCTVKKECTEKDLGQCISSTKEGMVEDMGMPKEDIMTKGGNTLEATRIVHLIATSEECTTKEGNMLSRGCTVRGKATRNLAIKKEGIVLKEERRILQPQKILDAQVFKPEIKKLISTTNRKRGVTQWSGSPLLPPRTIGISQARTPRFTFPARIRCTPNLGMA